jgi:hypothetical protein
MRETGNPLDDFPLHGEAAGGVIAAPAREAGLPSTPSGRTASLSTRVTAAAADAAAVLLLAALAILAARLVTGETPRPAGIAWAAGFVVYLSLFATVPPLVLFGKTVGMALAELSSRPEPGAGLPAAAATRRWLGTLVTAATAGLALLWTRSDPDAPTPADRFSGHALTVD